MIKYKAVGEYGERSRYRTNCSQVEWINSLDQNTVMANDALNSSSFSSSLCFWVLSKQICLCNRGHNHIDQAKLIFHESDSIKCSAESLLGINDKIINQVEEAIHWLLCCLLMFSLWAGTAFYTSLLQSCVVHRVIEN